ncbi:glycosyltransferase family 87 protein [Seohaeicola saemankumensis]|uniref:Glycosyltransferase family 87 protein n=1 Tax=Seohaeicola saemankumensis TaxID=481181 RepID=A0ABW3TF67_9RHOB
MIQGKTYTFDIRLPTKWFLIISMILLISFTAVEFAAPELLGKPVAFVDFHVFHLVGDYVSQGIAVQAYNFDAFQSHQNILNPGEEGFMPWTYPPQFNLLMAVLAPLPLWLAYLLFTSLSLGVFLFVLRKLDEDNFFLLLIFVLPVIFVTIRCGQNGFLTASLIGIFCLLLLKNKDSAGLPLGLMAIKPHLVFGIAILVLLRKKVGVLAIAVVVTSLAAVSSSIVLGEEIWLAFLKSAADSSTFLREAQYPLFRMTSVYAWIRSWGFEANVAFAAQIVTAVVAIGGVVWVHFNGWETRRILGLAVLASLSISPYKYDYDLCSLAIALALLMPDIARFASRSEMIALACASWLATGSGMIVYALPKKTIASLETWTQVGVVPSVGGIFFLGVAGLLIRLAKEGQRNSVDHNLMASKV